MVDEEPVDNPTSAPSMTPIEKAVSSAVNPPGNKYLNSIDDSRDNYHYQINQSTIKAGDTDHSIPIFASVDLNSTTIKSARAEHDDHKRGEADRSHQRNKLAKLSNKREILAVARIPVKADQMSENLGNLHNQSHTVEVKSTSHPADLSYSEGVQKDGFRAIIATMIVFGFLYYITIGLFILFGGYLFWGLIKMGRRHLYAK
jgi:hypothetical protein